MTFVHGHCWNLWARPISRFDPRFHLVFILVHCHALNEPKQLFGPNTVNDFFLSPLADREGIKIVGIAI